MYIIIIETTKKRIWLYSIKYREKNGWWKFFADLYNYYLGVAPEKVCRTSTLQIELHIGYL